MARIELRGLAHSYSAKPKGDADYALKRMDHVWQDGGAYALLGPSGCGKTTLLNIISGLLTSQQGQVLFDGMDVTAPAAAAAQHRPGVPVSGHLRHHDGGRKSRPFRCATAASAETEVSARVKRSPTCWNYGELGRRARGLTADAKQKISLGRGLVRSDVAAILFDEPLTVIDPQLKWLLRRKLKQIHERFQLEPGLRHPRPERGADLRRSGGGHERGPRGAARHAAGTVRGPAHTFVGYFIGSPGMNFLPCRLDGGAARSTALRMPLAGGAARSARARRRPLEIGIRPEFLRSAPTGPMARCRPRSSAVEDLGNYKIVDGRAGGRTRSRPSCRRTSAVAGERLAGLPADAPGSTPMAGWWPERRDRTMEKTHNNKAWLLVLPVVPARRLQRHHPADDRGELLGPGHPRPRARRSVGTEWFVQVLRTRSCTVPCCASWLFAAVVLLIEIPLGIALALTMPISGLAASLCLVLVALPLLIPWNVVGTIWQISAAADIGLAG